VADDALPDDMEVQEPGRELVLWQGTRLTLERVLLGESVVAEKYELTNLGSTAIEFLESDLFKSGVMAVSVEHPSLKPGEATSLFVIRERRGDD
jgi:conjugal transfer pilus assembly protein TraK